MFIKRSGRKTAAKKHSALKSGSFVRFHTNLIIIMISIEWDKEWIRYSTLCALAVKTFSICAFNFYFLVLLKYLRGYILKEIIILFPAHTIYFFNLSAIFLSVCHLLPRDGCSNHHIEQDHKYPFPALKLHSLGSGICHLTHINCNLSASENDPELSTHSDWIQ